MTTEPSTRGSSAWKPQPTPSALKPALAALLAAAYLLAWWAFGSRPARAPGMAESVVWYGDLPASQRPEVHLPEGWYLASPGARGPAAIRSAPLVRPARAVPARPGRIRTRSS